MTYLGDTLQADGGSASLNHKLAVAWSEFTKLERLWKHTSVTRAWKTQIFQAIITSRVLYGLSTMSYNIAERRRIDAFQAKCLRRILGIRPAYYSRVSNKSVLEIAMQRPLNFNGRIARAPDNDPLRMLTFCPGSRQAATSRYIRRAGRPRNEWATQMQELAIRIAASFESLENMIRNAASWNHTIDKYKDK